MNVAGDLTAPPRLVLRRWQIVAVAAVVPALLAGLYVASNLRASLAQRSLRAQWTAIVAAGPIEAADLSARSFEAGEPVARLGIPALGMDLIVVEGGAGTHRGPAHVVESVLPGLPGVTVVEGGRFGYGNMFMHLERLVPGDAIVAGTPAGERRFTVRSVTIVPAASIDPRRDSTVPTLLLVAPSRAWGSSDRIVVRAEAGPGGNPGGTG